MTIREMCDAFEVTPRTLRFYESRDLLAPIRQGQRRLFTRRDRARLKLILRGKRYGFSLDEIHEILDLYDPEHENVAQMRAACATARRRLPELVARRAELDSAIADLQSELDESERRLRKLTGTEAA